MTTQQFEVAIVGAGMVGASIALYLDSIGIRVLLLERNKGEPDIEETSTGFSARVSAISPASANWLKHTGVWQMLNQDRVSPYTQMQVWDGNGTGSTRFNAQDCQSDQLGWIIENIEIQRVQFQKLKQSGVQLVTQANVKTIEDNGDNKVLVLADGMSFSVNLIIGADGVDSKVREVTGFKTKSWDYQHHALVTTVKTQFGHQNTAFQVFLDKGPLAFLPLKNHQDPNHYCSIVWSTQPDHAEQLKKLSAIEFSKALQQASEMILGEIEIQDPIYSIPLQQCHATSYVKPGIALVGDAAHRIHPLAGQGVNLGFLDAAALCEVLEQAHQAKLNIGEEFFLRKYQRARQSHNLSMIAAMEGFKKLFQADAMPIRWLRNTGMNYFDRLPFVKEQTMRMAMGTSGPVPELCK